METFTVQPASVYFTLIQAIKVVPRKFLIPGELRDAQGPHSFPASKARGPSSLPSSWPCATALADTAAPQPSQPQDSLSH